VYTSSLEGGRWLGGACQDSRLGRRLGQHFLQNEAILESIATATCPENAETVVEIGPGKGALTAHLLPRAARVIAIEIDPVLVQYLRAKLRNEPKLTVLEADILKTDLAQWGRVTVTGNLPYYITSPILEKTLSLGPQLTRALFLVQKEVALRLTATPGTRDYGFLSVQTQLLSTPEFVFAVPASAFRPRPKVDSAVVRLAPRTEPAGVDHKRFLEFAGRCFRHKRKTIRNNLLGFYDRAVLDAIPASSKRAEQLSIPELTDLFRRLGDGRVPPLS
jgi:16S rRNA (adenine1518-N6/adenine1519-N6)-dimethyltransferase